MGQSESSDFFKSKLRTEFAGYEKWELSTVKKLTAAFEKIQTGFGFGVQIATFKKLFSLQDDAAKILFPLWDTDSNGVTDALEILSGLTLVSTGTFKAKVQGVFDLFDFDGNAVLVFDELSIMIKTSIIGLCKLTDCKEPAAGDLNKLATEAFASAKSSTKAMEITRDEFIAWVVSNPSAIRAVCHFGTADSDAVRKKYAEEQGAAIKIQKAFKKHGAVAGAAGAGVGAGAKKAAGSATERKAVGKSTGKTAETKTTLRSPKVTTTTRLQHKLPVGVNLKDIERAKAVFDVIDTDGSGSISVKELTEKMTGSGNSFLNTNVNAFYRMDKNNSGQVTFAEMLKMLYPKCNADELQRMMTTVKVPPLGHERIREMQRILEDLDSDFDGRHTLSELVRECKETKSLTKYFKDLPAKLFSDKKTVDFHTFLREVFTKNYEKKLPQILAWAEERPTRALTRDQHRQLEDLFNLYDRDGSGTISLVELKEHLSEPGMGFSKDFLSTIDGLFTKYDSDGSKSVDLNEFKRFYRSVWDTSTRFNVTMLGQAKGGAGAGAAAGTTVSKQGVVSQQSFAAGFGQKPVAEEDDEYLFADDD